MYLDSSKMIMSFLCSEITGLGSTTCLEILEAFLRVLCFIN